MKEIFERRSVRKYADGPVPEEVTEKLLRAAMRAPSAMNRQPWEFVVVRERAVLDALSRVHPFAGMLKQAPCAIAVCGDGGRGRAGFWVQDCSAATQNLLLEAVHLGLGAVWLGIYPLEKRMEAVQELLCLPKHIVPLNIVSLGYPAEDPEPLDTYDPGRVHRERWQGRHKGGV